jgi:hypothetical protein
MELKAAFTKKDLVVALGCIVFLLANIAAIGEGGRKRAKETVCISNLYKWGEIFQDYLADNDGFFWQGFNYNFTPETSGWWFDKTASYYNNDMRLRCCPLATDPTDGVRVWELSGPGYYDGSRTESPDYGSYGINGWVENQDVDIAGGPPDLTRYWRTPNVTGGGTIPLLFDEPWIDAWPLDTDAPPDYDNQVWGSCNQMGRLCKNRHDGYICMLFLDFSVRKVGLKELWTLKWHKKYNTCGTYTKCGRFRQAGWPKWMQDFKDY